MGVLIEKGWISYNEFIEIMSYHDSIVGIIGKYLPDNLTYTPPTLSNVILCRWRQFIRELEVFSNIEDVHLWMLAVCFFSGGFMVFQNKSCNADMEVIAKEWAFRGDFVEEKLLDHAQRGELGVQWIVLTSLRSKKSGLQCLTLLSKDVDFLDRVRSCCESVGLVTHCDLDF